MSELKPCKCRCGVNLVPVGSGWFNHPTNGCLLADNDFAPDEVVKFVALMDDTPDLLRGARIGLDMAAKIGEGGLDELDQDWFLPKLRAITDADIMKEISRE